ncbi:tRNA uridine-5-carboxymethylaminomethyl(34) synthesis GTPase MnmE [Rhodobacteraceae bacterium 2376]|uniref:tRNA modification GTPase MnmE n=1 Tax=Rhabdonatronobacter sediminivivens TaxID=2743469 RepID=A0A7Z0HXP2_9RHOB|nr:tRNA uridine-5-carboxymethylaminomethyl(34) synthesis GTPase MnmE [Rhabdonatronobacter sediminivivens]NYS23759.1 tRNA uridine-5-carboxymethylaminomethyl(34) synthesis GTPase MnmE [Rhabdonatronobacter sediminivivens]
MDTIYALATARGRAGVAVIRVSGPAAWDAATTLAGTGLMPRVPSLRKLRGACGSVLDTGLVLLFEDGASFTGERVAELMIHGSPAGVAAVEGELGRMPGLRHAEAGEFTRRALADGRLDLVQVEALADLVDSDTEFQRKQAIRLLEGAAGKTIGQWRGKLVRALALLEAGIDFAEEQLGDFMGEISANLEQVIREIDTELDGMRARERIRSGFEVAILGPVNAGKSTLLNALAGREAAITSHIAGTTRDVIEVQMDLGGFPVTLLDTAGLRDSDDEIEQIGIARARQRADDADIRVILLEHRGADPAVPPRADDIVIVGKADIQAAGSGGVSGVTGQGIDLLLQRLEDRLQERVTPDGFAVRARHEQGLRAARDRLEKAFGCVQDVDGMVELAAADISAAVHALDSLIGKVDVEDLLDDIFASFCIGK